METLFLIFFFIFSCSPQESNKKILRTILSEKVTHFDPRFQQNNLTSFIFEDLLYCKLVNFNENNELILELAEKLTWLNEKSLKITLKKNFFFEDQAVTSHDVAYTYNQLKNNLTIPRNYFFQKIKEIKILDNNTLIFNLEDKIPYFEASLVIGIIPSSSPSTKVKSFIKTCGSFQLVESSYRHILLKRKKDNLLIHFSLVQDDQIKFLKFLRGDFDFTINAFNPELTREILHRNSSLKKIEKISSSTTYLAFNFRKNISLEQRQFIYSLIPYNTIINHLLKDNVSLAQSLLPFYYKEFKSFNKKNIFSKPIFNQPLTLLTTQSENVLKIIPLLQQVFHQNHIPIHIESYEWSVYLKKILNNEADLYIGSVVGFKTLDIFQYLFHSKSIPPKGMNRNYYQNPILDEALNKNNYSLAQKILHEDLPMIFLWHENYTLLYKQHLKNIKLYADGRLSFLKEIILD